MKKILILPLAFLFFSAHAQSEKYQKTMEARVIAIDTSRNPSDLTDLANAFERIAEAEKTQWLPYYYAALATVNSGTTTSSGGRSTPTAQPPADQTIRSLTAVTRRLMARPIVARVVSPPSPTTTARRRQPDRRSLSPTPGAPPTP